MNKEKAIGLVAILLWMAAVTTALMFTVRAVDVRGERTHEVELLSADLQSNRNAQQLLRRAKSFREKELAETFEEWVLVDAKVDSLTSDLSDVEKRLEDIESILTGKRDRLGDLKRDVRRLEAQRDKLAAEAARKAAAEVAKNAVVPPLAPTTTLPRPSNCPSGQNITVIATGYSSTPDQTWGDPYTTYTGTRVHWGTVAVHPSVIPLGCRMSISAFPGTVFIAEDRGGGINGYRIDIWFPTRQEALNWGVRTVTVTIL